MKDSNETWGRKLVTRLICGFCLSSSKYGCYTNFIAAKKWMNFCFKTMRNDLICNEIVEIVLTEDGCHTSFKKEWRSTESSSIKCNKQHNKTALNYHNLSIVALQNTKRFQITISSPFQNLMDYHHALCLNWALDFQYCSKYTLFLQKWTTLIWWISVYTNWPTVISRSI